MPTQATDCHNCGHPVSTGARFCQNCGADVSQEQSQLATMSVNVPPRKTAQEAALELLRLETLGDYEILGELGRGGMATVYLAHDISLDRRVAIKVMSPALVDEGLAERFRREARTAASLNHPHVIPIYAVRERGTLLFFVMKFIPGQSLDPIMSSLGAMPIPMAQVILAQAASALGYAHRRGVIHRDVKPANIMLDDDGWVVMTDFGIAKVSTATGLTMTGVTVGTPAYMSPEQCLGKEVTGASDQYSLGVVAYEMLTGRKPFVANTAMAMMYAHFNEEPKPLREIRPGIPEDLEATVLRMLAKEPDQRWPKIDDAFGAPALAHDDPTRQQLISLAQSSTNAIMSSRLSTPTSPIPPVRRSSTRPAGEVAPPAPAGAPVAPALEPTVQAPAPAPAAPVSKAPPARGSARIAAGATTPIVRRPTRTAQPPRLRQARVLPAWLPWAGGAAALGVVAAVLLWPRSHPTPPKPVDSVSTTTTDAPQPPAKGTGVVVPSGAETTESVGTAKPPAPPAAVTVARVQLRPARLDLDAGSTGRLSAQLFAAGGSSIDDQRQVTWTSSAPTIATVGPDGSVQAIGAGKAMITATVEGKSARAQVTVRATQPVPPGPAPSTVAAVSVTPETATVSVGREITLTALVRNARGDRLGDREPTWTSSDGSVSVSPTGQVRGRAPGTAVVTATVEGHSARASIRVTPASVAGVKLSAPPGALKPGDSVQLTATGVDADGAALSDRKIGWGSGDSGVASVSGGRVVAHAPGTTTVTASIEGRTASVPIVVSAPSPDPALERERATREINRQLDAFVEALNSLDLAKLKGAYPGMSRAEEDRWRQTMTSPRPTRLRASHDPLPAPRVTGSAAEVPYTLHMRPEYPGARAPEVTIAYLAQFELEDGKWQLRRLQQR
jgi:serine/threonine-protein kinase